MQRMGSVRQQAVMSGRVVAVREGDQSPLWHKGFRPPKIDVLSPALSGVARQSREGRQ